MPLLLPLATTAGRGPAGLRPAARHRPQPRRPPRGAARHGRCRSPPRVAVDEKIEHIGLGDLLASCAGPKIGEMRACQSV